MFKFLKNIFQKNDEKVSLDIKINLVAIEEKKEKTIKEIPDYFREYLYVLFAKHLTKRNKRNINYVISNIASVYFDNPRILFNDMIGQKKLIEMNSLEKLEVLTIPELKERFNFKKKVKKDILEEIKQNYKEIEIRQRTAEKYYKLSEEYEKKYSELLQEYDKNSKILFNSVIENIVTFNFKNILNTELKELPTKSDLYNNYERQLSIIEVKDDYYVKRLEEYEKIDMKKYIMNDEEYIKNFKYYYFSSMINSENELKYRKYFLKNEYPNIDYNYYNQKYFDYKRNIENQIFENFISYLNIKISNEIKIIELKNAGLDIEIFNVCPVHKEKNPCLENINKEIFCTCEVV